MPDYCVVRQRAGSLVKVFATDNRRFVRGNGDFSQSARTRCGPAMSRTSVDRLELRMALFGVRGVHYVLTFDDDHLPWDYRELRRRWDAFCKRLRRMHGRAVDMCYCMEGLHGDKRYHIHLFLDGEACPVDAIRRLWQWGLVHATAYDWRRLREEHGYRKLAEYFCKERTDGVTFPLGKHPWGCSRSLEQRLRPPDVRSALSERILVPPGALTLRREAKVGEWGRYAYVVYLLPPVTGDEKTALK